MLNFNSNMHSNLLHNAARRLCLLLLAATIFSSPDVTASEQPTEEDAVEVLDAQEESSEKGIEKFWCNVAGYSCNGTFGELFVDFYTDRNGKVRAEVTELLGLAITAGTECTLETSLYIEVRAAGGDKTLLEQLYLSKLSGDLFKIRLESVDGTPAGNCRIAYIRALYTD